MTDMKKTKRLHSADLMKGIAMLMVILVHYNQSFQHGVRIFMFGQMGCQIFFVISGFMSAGSFERKCEKEAFKGAVSDFYRTRIKAIAPAYYLMMAVVWISNTVLIAASGQGQSFGRCRSFAGILCNILFLNGLVPAYNNNVMPGGWYIGTTMIFYFLTPWLYRLFDREKQKKGYLKVFIGISLLSESVIIAASFLFPMLEDMLLKNNSFGYYSFLYQMPCFAAGMLLHFGIRDAEPDGMKTGIKYLFGGTALILLSVLLYFRPVTGFSYILTVTLVGISASLLLKGLFILEQERSAALRGGIWRGIERIGAESFFYYLTHPFFVWTFVAQVKKCLTIWQIDPENVLWYVVLLPVVILLTGYSAKLLHFIVKKINFVRR